MLLFVINHLWSIIGDSGFVVSSVVSSHPALLSFHMLTGNVDRALGGMAQHPDAPFLRGMPLAAAAPFKQFGPLVFCNDALHL